MIYDKQSLKEYLFKEENKNQVGVLCRTKEDALEFCSFMNECGKKWMSGTSYLDNTEYDFYKSETVYFPSGVYANLEYAQKNGIKILVMGDDIIFDDFAPQDDGIEHFLSEFNVNIL